MPRFYEINRPSIKMNLLYYCKEGKCLEDIYSGPTNVTLKIIREGKTMQKEEINNF